MELAALPEELADAAEALEVPVDEADCAPEVEVAVAAASVDESEARAEERPAETDAVTDWVPVEEEELPYALAALQ